MIKHPAVLSLLISSFLTCSMILFAGWKGLAVVKRWDLDSGSELQLRLERSTYLISTILGCALFFQAASLFLFIFTTDYLHSMFYGAMCAAGSLNANRFGYPALLLKIATCLCAGVWLIINHVDNQGYDYPLIRVKYTLLLSLVPFFLAETVLQAVYFGTLNPQVITSCCGSLFSSGAGTIASELAGFPRKPMEIAIASGISITVFSGVNFMKTGKGACFFAVASILTFVTGIASLISFISLYIYELPSHHCPFCILQKEYGYIGYPLYATLFFGAISGVGVGVLNPARKKGSISEVVAGVQGRLAFVSVALFLLFGLLVVYSVAVSPLKL